jgi:hypothetical protein
VNDYVSFSIRSIAFQTGGWAETWIPPVGANILNPAKWLYGKSIVPLQPLLARMVKQDVQVLGDIKMKIFC